MCNVVVSASSVGVFVVVVSSIWSGGLIKHNFWNWYIFLGYTLTSPLNEFLVDFF